MYCTEVCQDLRQKILDDPTLHVKGHHWGWDLGVWTWHRDQTTVFVVEEPSISKSKEGDAGQKHDQEHAQYSSTFAGLCTMNASLRARPSAPTFTAIFWGVWWRRLLHIWRKRPELWHKGKYRAFEAHHHCPQQHDHPSSPTLLAIFSPLQFLPLPEDKYQSEGLLFWNYRQDSVQIAESVSQASRTGLLETFWKMENMLGMVLPCTKGLFWGRYGQTSLKKIFCCIQA